MARTRTQGLVGLLWSVLALAAVLSFVDLTRGSDSRLRSWWTDLRVTRAESTGQILKEFRENPGALRPK